MTSLFIFINGVCWIEMNNEHFAQLKDFFFSNDGEQCQIESKLVLSIKQVLVMVGFSFSSNFLTIGWF